MWMENQSICISQQIRTTQVWCGYGGVHDKLGFPTLSLQTWQFLFTAVYLLVLFTFIIILGFDYLLCVGESNWSPVYFLWCVFSIKWQPWNENIVFLVLLALHSWEWPRGTQLSRCAVNRELFSDASCLAKALNIRARLLNRHWK